MDKTIAVVAFTTSGQERMAEIRDAFDTINGESMDQWKVDFVYRPLSVKDWCEEAFKTYDAIFFVCAIGIAVRAIAPYIVAKTSDPAIIVMDDMGSNIVSLLSGHIGGANELTGRLGALLEAHPVITTSSDVHGRIAVDSWATRNGMLITDMDAAKRVAMEIVEGRKVGLYTDMKIKGIIPEELVPLDGNHKFYKDMRWCIIVSDKVLSKVAADLEDYKILWLIPRRYVIGIGCKKGKSEAEIEEAVMSVLYEMGIDLRSISHVASIDIKSEEQGLLAFCKNNNLPISFYPAEDLQRVWGEFESSEFVKSVTGVDNVCERAALYHLSLSDKKVSRERNLIKAKTKCDGVTVALAAKKGSIEFE